MPSQAIASSSAECKADRPPGNLVSGQSFTMCNIVCKGAPQEQDGSEAWFQRTRLAAHRPWPVRKWFNVDYKRRRLDVDRIQEVQWKGPRSVSGLLHLKQPTLQSISVVVTLFPVVVPRAILDVVMSGGLQDGTSAYWLSLIHIWRCRRRG